MSRPQNCQHIHQDGRRCGSPALRNKRFCYFHHAARRQHPHRVARGPLLPDWPIVEDPRSAQLAINQVLQGLAGGFLDARTAGQLIYSVQIALATLKPAADLTDPHR